VRYGIEDERGMTMDTKRTSTAAASFWILTLSILFGPIVVLGPFLAGVIGGRKVRVVGQALSAAVLPALISAGFWYWFCGHEVAIGGNKITLPLELRALSPATALAIFGGALAGTAARPARVLGVALGIFAALWFAGPARHFWRLYQTFQPSGETYVAEQNKTCPDHLKNLYDAAMLYADAYDGTLPPAERWMTALQDPTQRFAEDDWLHCPEAGGANRYGYAMNSDLGGKRLVDLAAKADTPLFYDSTSSDRDARDAVTTLPKPGRHTGKNNVVYVDGHVAQQ
jgi:prepilin-type processing-associated H-X9-DG protein